MDRQRACEIMEVKTDASKDEILKRYNILLKKYKSIDSNKNNISINDINEAYNILMGYEYHDAEAEALREKKKNNPNFIYKKLNIDQNKAENFFHYYKFHIIISIIVLIVLGTTIKGCVSRIPSDLNIIFVGKIYCQDQEKLKQNIVKETPNIKEASVQFIAISGEDKSEQDYALRMKAMVEMAAGEVDMFILDRENFESYAKQGAFMDLDLLASELEIKKEENEENILSVVDSEGNSSSDSKHLYGINIKNSSLLKENNVVGEEMIAAIRVNPTHYENAIELIKKLIKE